MAGMLTWGLVGAVLITWVTCFNFGDVNLMYEWAGVDIAWSSKSQRDEFVKNGSYVQNKNIMTGIKVFENQVYVTVPRWRALTGIPVTLGKVVAPVAGAPLISPYPNWDWQTVGDCRRLQFVQSMEIDPGTGLMYVIDTGRIGLASNSPNYSRNLCPAKIVVFDLKSDEHVASYEVESASREENFLNDIVLDYVNGEVRYAYITDVQDNKLHVLDFKTKKSWGLHDESMNQELGGIDILIHGRNYTFDAGIDGIAISPDFAHVYFCPLGGYSLYEVPTFSLRQKSLRGLRLVGWKYSQTDGMVFSSSNRLYFGALQNDAVYFSDFRNSTNQHRGPDDVTLASQVLLIKDEQKMQWPDTFAIDEAGWLWFMSNRLFLWTSRYMNMTTSEKNMRIWKVFVDEKSYLHGAKERSQILSSGKADS